MINLFRRSNANERRSEEHPVAGDLIFAFDLGSSTVRLTAAEVDENGVVCIRGYREQVSQGIKGGSVIDINALSMTLSELTREFEGAYSVHIERCVVGVPGTFISSSNQFGSATVKGSSVTTADQEAAIENARSGANFNDSEYDRLHTVLQNYITENSNEIINPIGQFAKRLNVEVHVVALKRSHAMNVSNVFYSLRPELRSPSFIYTGIAAADAVLTESQKELGVCLIDIGAGTTNVAVYDNRKLMLTFGLDRGGEGITQQISKTFGLPRNIAEELKKEMGVATTMALTEEQRNQIINVNIGDTEHPQPIPVPYMDLSICINKHLSDIFRLVTDRIQRIALEKKLTLNLSAGFVITGGVANTNGIETLFSEQDASPYNTGALANRVHVGKPRAVEIKDLSGAQLDLETMTKPQQAVTIGMIRQYWREIRSQFQDDEDDAEPTGMVGKLVGLKKWFNKEW